MATVISEQPKINPLGFMQCLVVLHTTIALRGNSLACNPPLWLAKFGILSPAKGDIFWWKWFPGHRNSFFLWRTASRVAKQVTDAFKSEFSIGRTQRRQMLGFWRKTGCSYLPPPMLFWERKKKIFKDLWSPCELIVGLWIFVAQLLDRGSFPFVPG